MGLFWSTWRLNTVPNIDVCRSINTKPYRAANLSPLQRLLDPPNHPLIHTMCPTMMKHTWPLTMWPRRHPDEVITQHSSWPPPGSIWIYRLKHQSTGGKLIEISMITTVTQWRLIVHFGYRTQLTGASKKRKCTQSTLISEMWHVTYSPSYHMVSEWRPVFPLSEMLLVGGSHKPQARPFGKKSL